MNFGDGIINKTKVYLFQKKIRNKFYVMYLFNASKFDSIYSEFFNSVLKYDDIKAFFRQDFIIEYFTKNKDVYTNNSRLCKIQKYLYDSTGLNLFDFYDYDMQIKLGNIILSFYNFSWVPSDLNILPENIFRDIVDNLDSEKKNLLIDNFTSSINHDSGHLNECIEKNLFEISKDRLDNFSIDKKYKFIGCLHNKNNRKEAFYFFNFDTKLDLFFECNSGFDSSYDIFEFVDENIIFNKFLETMNIQYLRILSPEYQIKAFNEFEKKKIDISPYLKLETRKKLFDDNRIILDCDELYKIYKKYKNVLYLYCIRELYLNNIFEIAVNVICEDDFVSLLTENEKSVIISKLNEKKYFYIPHGQVKFNDFFFKKYKEVMIKYYVEHPNEITNISIEDIMDIFTLDEQLIIIRHFKKNYLIDKAITNDKYLEFLLKLLKHNPNIINECLGNAENINIDISYAEEYDSLLKIIDYIDSKNISYRINKNIIEESDKLREYFYNNLYKNPNIVTDIETLDLLDEEQINYVLDKIDIKKLESMIVRGEKKLEKYGDILFKYFYNRFDEYIEYINGKKIITEFDSNSIFEFLDSEHINILITNTNSVTYLSNIIKNNPDYSEFVIERLLESYETNIRSSYKIESNSLGNLNLKFHNADMVKKIVSKMNFLQAIYCYSEYPDNLVEQQIIKKLKECPEDLIDEGIINQIKNIYFLLSEENRLLITNILNDKMNNNELYNNDLSKYIHGIDNYDKIKYLDYYDKGYIKENYELVIKLLKSNPFLFKTVDSIIFNKEIKNLDFRFLEKMSKYKNIETKIYLISMNENKFKLFIKICNYLDKKNYSDSVYDRLISELIKYILSNRINKINYTEVDDKKIEEIIQFILHDCINLNRVNKTNYSKLEKMYEFDIEDFINIRRAKCDELFYSLEDINDMKNIFFNKFFGMSLTDINKFHKKYIYNYDKVHKYAKNELPLLFINIINKVLDINDPITLKELYMNNDIYYDISDIYEIESIMSNTYFESLVNDYKEKPNGELVRKKFKDKEGNEVELEMTELIDDFGILVHSTCAYGEMPLIDDDYYKSWNYNPNTENHGICCSYINNSSYGTADVTDNGVMFGFTNLTTSSVAEYSPYDLSSYNYGFYITCYYEPFYTLLDDIPNYTRHTHNEFVLERRIPNDKHFCVQPDCIIIFEDMDDNIKANSIKAYNDFKKSGIELKLIYMDRVKIAHKEARKLKNMIIEYSNSKDLNLLKEIINKYESNICSCDFLSIGNIYSKKLFDKDELFMTDTISNLLFTTLDEINELHDVDRFIYYLSILQSEQFKFNLIDDKNPDRKHTFKLYSDELKAKIEIVKQNLNINQNENTK